MARCWPFAALVCLCFAAVAPASEPAPRLDEHGFPLPTGALRRLGDLRFVHPGGILALASSPDGKLVATSGAMSYKSHPDTIRLWNSTTGQLLREFWIPKQCGYLAFSKDSRLLAAGGEAYQVVIDVSTQRRLWQEQYSAPKPGTNTLQPCLGLTFLDDNRSLALQYSTRVQLCDARTGKRGRAWEIDREKRRLASWYSEKAAFTEVALSPDGKRLACLLGWSQKTALLIFDAATNQLLHRIHPLPTTDCDLSGVRFAPDSRTIAILDPTHRLHTIDVASGKLLGSIGFPPDEDPRNERNFERGCNLAFSWDGKLFALGRAEELVLWDVRRGKAVARHPCHFGKVAWSADGGVLFGTSDSRVRMWRRHKEDRPTAPTEFSEAPAVHFASHDRLVTWDTHGLRQTWNPGTGQRLEGAHLGPFPKGGLSWDSVPANRVLHRRATPEAGLWLYQLSPPRALRQLIVKDYDPAVTAFDLSDDASTWVRWERRRDGGNWVMQAEEADTGRRLGTFTLKQKSFPMSGGWGGSGQLSRDGQLQIAFAEDGKLLLLCTRTGKLLHTLDPPARWQRSRDRELLRRNNETPEGAPDVLRFSPNARYLAVGYHPLGEPGIPTLGIWDIQRGQEIRRLTATLKESLDQLGTLAFSPDNHWFVRLNGDGQIAVVELASGSERGRIDTGSQVEYLALSPDGKLLASSGSDTSVLLWDLDRQLAGEPLPSPRSREDLERLWLGLTNPDAAQAEPARWALLRAPKVSLPFLAERLRPVPPSAVDRVRQLIDKLDAGSFRVREKALQEIVEVCDLAFPVVQEALAQGDRSLEVQQRLKGLVGKLHDPTRPARDLRELRAVEVLERIGTPATRAVLRTVADGAPQAGLTRAARKRWNGGKEQGMLGIVAAGDFGDTSGGEDCRFSRRATMTIPTTVPVSIDPEASAYISQLGLQQPFEEILERAVQAMPGVRSVRVEVQPPHDMGGEDVVLIEIERDDPQLEDDATDRNFGAWKVRHFSPDVFQYFVVFSVYPG